MTLMSLKRVPLLKCAASLGQFTTDQQKKIKSLHDHPSSPPPSRIPASSQTYVAECLFAFNQKVILDKAIIKLVYKCSQNINYTSAVGNGATFTFYQIVVILFIKV